MRRTTLVFGLAFFLVLAGLAQAFITQLTPLAKVLVEEQYILVARVEKLDPDRPAMVLTVEEHLKGKFPHARLSINLRGDAEAKKHGHTALLLKRVAVKTPLVLFAHKEEKTWFAFAYTHGTWFQMTASETGEEAPVWAFTHGEPYLRRTFKGTTEEMRQVVVDGLSGKKKPPPPDEKEKPGFGPEIEGDKRQGRLRSSQGPLFAVIPTAALGGILSLLAMLFPAVFGGLTGQLKRWLAIISIASLNSTLLFLQDWYGALLQGSWWGTQDALWVGMTTLTALGVLWAWRRHLNAVVSIQGTPKLSEAPFLPGRGEMVLLLILSGIGVGVLGIGHWLGYSLKTLPWSFVLTLWVGIWLGAAHTVLARVRGPRQFPALSAEGVILGGMLPPSLLLALATSTAVPTGGNVEVSRVQGVQYLGEAWTFQPEGSGFFVSSPVEANDRLYIAAAHTRSIRSFGKLYCLDAKSGAKIWEFADEGRMKQVFSTPCVSEGRLYVGEGFHQDFGCKLYCIDAQSGKLLWSKETESHTESTPTVADGRVFFGAGDDGIYCLNAATGEEFWHFNDGLHVDAAPLVVQGRVYVGSGIGDLHKTLALICLDAASGRPLWRVPVDYPAWGMPTLEGETLYLGIGNGNFVQGDPNPAGAVLAVRASDGVRLWRRDLPDGVLCKPTLTNRRIHVVARDGFCYALNKEDGAILWKRDIASPGLASPVLDPGTGVRKDSLYVVGSKGRLCCLDPETGEIYWTFNITKLDAEMLSTPLIRPHPGGGDDHRRIFLGAGINQRGTAILYAHEDHWPTR